MTTPDQHEPVDDEPGTGSHSAPRPLPPLDGARGTSPSEAGADDPTATAPMRVSAFPAFDRPGSAGEAGAAPSSDLEATTALPSSPTPVVHHSPEAMTTTQVVPAGLGAGGPASQPAQTPQSTGYVPVMTTGERPEPIPASAQLATDWEEKPESRTATRLWGILGVLVLAPLTWFFLTDGVLRTFYSLDTPDSSVNAAGLVNLGVGLVLLLLLALIARSTSLGFWIWGTLIAAAGITFLVVPGPAMEWFEQSRSTFLVVHEGFGTNLYNYLLDAGRSGLLIVYGLFLVFFALISRGARTQGRREGERLAELRIGRPLERNGRER